MITIIWNDFQTVVFTAAMLSLVGDIIIISTFYVSKRWRNEMTEMKKIILALSLYHIFFLIAFIDVNISDADSFCQIQASLIQFFGVGTIVYEGFVAVECYALCLSVFKGDVTYTHRADDPSFPRLKKGCGASLNYLHHCLAARFRERRHFLYHAFVFCYGATSAALMNIYHYYGTSSTLDNICWIKERKFNMLFGVAPMVISILTVIIFNSRVIYLIVSAFGSQATDSTITSSLNEPCTVKDFIHDKLSDIRDAVSEVHCRPEALPEIVAEEAMKIPLVKSGALFISLFQRLSPRAQNAFLRLIAVPVCFVLMGLPGVIRRFLVMDGFSPNHVLNVVTLTCAVMGGVVNCFIWVISDQAVLHDWSLLFGRIWHQLYHHNCDFSSDCGEDCHMQRFSSFSGPESEYSGHEPEEFITPDRDRESFTNARLECLSDEYANVHTALKSSIGTL
jgi:hypothetical protein